MTTQLRLHSPRDPAQAAVRVKLLERIDAGRYDVPASVEIVTLDGDDWMVVEVRTLRPGLVLDVYLHDPRRVLLEEAHP